MTQTPKYKSTLEKRFGEQFALPYETNTLKYVQAHSYCPDWKLGPHHYVETKGRWTGAERTKLRLVLAQHPEVTIVMVFSNPATPLNKGSKTSYGSYCEKLGVPYFKAGSVELAAYISANAVQTESRPHRP